MTGMSKKKWHEARIKRGEVVGGGYFVFRRGETTGRLKINPHKLPFEHDSLDKATREALRLSRQNPGITFAVFREVTAFIEPKKDTAE